MQRTPLITLLSDFGLRDPYVAEMKGVILSICPNAVIVDISHEVRKFDVQMGAFILAQAAPYFPKGTIHVAVVDPGVGTKRRPIIVETENNLYVGPDNGLLMLSAQNQGMNCIREIANSKYMLESVSRTFHGRDIFSPAAAYLAKGVHPSDFGPEIRDPVIPSFARPRVGRGEILGEVIHVDGFGNLITNVTLKDLEAIGIEEGEHLLLRLRERELAMRFCSAYGEVAQNTPLAIVGSSGFLEVSVNQGDASQTFNTQAGDGVLFKPSTPPSNRKNRSEATS